MKSKCSSGKCVKLKYTTIVEVISITLSFESKNLSPQDTQVKVYSVSGYLVEAYLSPQTGINKGCALATTQDLNRLTNL